MVLGAITIGDDVRIGSGSVVINSIPAGRTVVGVPGRMVQNGHQPIIDLEHAKLPDPVADAINLVLSEQDRLKKRLRILEGISNIESSEEEVVSEPRREIIEKVFNQGGGI